jgi:L-threonylcarbamoyladenylate synthase
MTTTILSAADGIPAAAEIIKEGGLVAFPTETVYGLGANAFDPSAVKKIFETKGRPGDNPLIVHIADFDDIRTLSEEIPDCLSFLAEKFMPGALTVILKKSAAVPYDVTAGGETVGVRMPSHPAAREFIRACGVPIAAPSANVSAHVSPTSALHVFEDLNGKIPLIIDGGECELGIESTVLDLTQSKPAILRPGAVTREMLSELLPDITCAYGKKDAAKEGITRSPGTKYRHYAPRVPAVLAADAAEAIALYDKKHAEGVNAVLILKEESAVKAANILMYAENEKRTAPNERIHSENSARRVLSMGKDNPETARNIYRLLRLAENDYEFIIIESVDGSGVGAAVLNRLSKATAHTKAADTETTFKNAEEKRLIETTAHSESPDAETAFKNAKKKYLAEIAAHSEAQNAETAFKNAEKNKTADFQKSKTVAFICAGNTCRSIMLEAIVRRELNARGITGVEIISAGTNVTPFSVTSEGAVDALAAVGIEVPQKKSVSLNFAVLQRADLVIAAAAYIKDKILRMFAVSASSFKDKLFSYAEITAAHDIPDPIGNPALYAEIAERLVADSPAVVDFILKFFNLN